MWIELFGNLKTGIKYRCIPEEEYDALQASHTKLVEAIQSNSKKKKIPQKKEKTKLKWECL